MLQVAKDTVDMVNNKGLSFNVDNQVIAVEKAELNPDAVIIGRPSVWLHLGLMPRPVLDISLIPRPVLDISLIPRLVLDISLVPRLVLYIIMSLVLIFLPLS